MVTCRVPSDWLTDISACWYDWQTFIAGLLALVGAYWTVHHIRKQIAQAQSDREDEISRRHRAARIALPLTLASISELIDEIGDNASAARERFHPDGKERLESILDASPLPQHFERIAIPQSTLESFQSFVETLNDQSEIEHIHELLATIQVLVSRYNSFDLHGLGAAANLDDLLIYTAKAKLLNDVIFDYSRRPSARNFSLVRGVSNEGIWDQIHASAQSLVFRRQSPDFFFPAFTEIIGRRKDAGTSPWIHGN